MSETKIPEKILRISHPICRSEHDYNKKVDVYNSITDTAERRVLYKGIQNLESMIDCE